MITKDKIMSYKVFIPTAGIGSRLGSLTKSINKSLVSLDNRPIITHLLDQFPDNCEFIIALGHKGNFVKQFLENLYPEKNIRYVFVDPYIGKKFWLRLHLNIFKTLSTRSISFYILRYFNS